MALLMRRTLMRTKAPIFKGLRRIVPKVASAKCTAARGCRLVPGQRAKNGKLFFAPSYTDPECLALGSCGWKSRIN
jgi:hypothetical protein